MGQKFSLDEKNTERRKYCPRKTNLQLYAIYLVISNFTWTHLAVLCIVNPYV